MPRTERKKFDNAIYHVMVRSISEVKLFKDNKDKDEYLKQMKHYQKIYKFKVYGYCLMSNHGHFIIDSNGADISEIMHCLNFKYAITFNRIHKRHGHLFQDRFKSKIVDSDRYLIALSAYIHNNVLSIRGYENCPEKYKYSSLKAYLGVEKDKTGLLDEAFIMQRFSHNVKRAREKYAKLVYLCNDEKMKRELEFEDEKTEYRSERKIIVRNFKPEEILEFLSEETGINKAMVFIKNNKNAKIIRALAVLIMRSLCSVKHKDISEILGNITQSRVSKLCSMGVDIISNEEKYSGLIERFILKYGSSKVVGFST